MFLSYYFIIFVKNMYIMNKIKYLPTDYSSNKDVIKTSWSIDPEMTEIFGYQPRLRNSIVFTQESSSGTTTDSAQEVESKQETDTKPKQETYTKPAQKSVWAKAVSKPAETVSKPTTIVPDLATLIPVLPTSKKSEEVPIQEIVQDNPISVQTAQNTAKPEQRVDAQEVAEPKEGKVYTNPQDFVKDMTDAYIKVLTAKGISTDYAKMLVAQDALESNWGKSSLSKAFNLGGVKAIEGVPFVEKETTEYNSKKGMYKTKARFRKFNSLEDYANYKINLLNGKRYRAFTGDPSQFYHRVKAGGYATDPKYVEKLMKIYNNPIFSAKQGGNLPSRIDLLVEKFNKQFNR